MDPGITSGGGEKNNASEDGMLGSNFGMEGWEVTE
jgi:hypothetical protein